MLKETAKMIRLAAIVALTAATWLMPSLSTAQQTPGAASRFTLAETRTGAVSGPYTLYNGARIRVGGELFKIIIDGDRRVSFVSETGEKYGPYQPVPGRIMQIGNAMYSFNRQGASAQTATRPREPAKEAPIAEFAPLPPKPEPIAIPDETPRRSVTPLNLPSLPDADSPLAWKAWFAPVDNTPLKWEVESFKGKSADFKRKTLGAGLSYDSWFGEAAYSFSGESPAMIPDGLGLSGTSIDDASGWSFGIGYKRPFLKEGGWTASAGLFGRIRQDKGDARATSFVSTGEADTNNAENVVSSYAEQKSSVKISEKTLRLDFDLSYGYGRFCGYAGLRLQPVSSVSVSGHIPSGDEKLKLSAKHDDAIGFSCGSSYSFSNSLNIFAELEMGIETRLRLGLSRSF